MIHYPIAPHKQKAYQKWNQEVFPITELIQNTVISLPMNHTLNEAEATKIIEICNIFV
jgi:dTDP-4-amino-4,6-dideoxygalactose transaminase